MTCWILRAAGDDPLNGDVGHPTSSAFGAASNLLDSACSQGDRMKKVITRIAPWQSAKTLAVVYFAIGVLIAVPIGLVSSLFPAEPGQAKPGPLFFVFMPILYGIASLIFVPIGCWIYNKAASLVGGIEIDVETTSDA